MLTTLGRVLLLALAGLGMVLRHRALQGRGIQEIPPPWRIPLWFGFWAVLLVAAWLAVGPHAP
jgi:hypothetical protein